MRCKDWCRNLLHQDPWKLHVATIWKLVGLFWIMIKLVGLRNGESRIHRLKKNGGQCPDTPELEKLKSYSVRCDFGSWTNMPNPNPYCLGSPKFPARTYSQKYPKMIFLLKWIFHRGVPNGHFGSALLFWDKQQAICRCQTKGCIFWSIGRPPKSWWQPPIWMWMVGNFSAWKGGGMEGCSLGGIKIFANKHKVGPSCEWSYIYPFLRSGKQQPHRDPKTGWVLEDFQFGLRYFGGFFHHENRVFFSRHSHGPRHVSNWAKKKRLWYYSA